MNNFLDEAYKYFCGHFNMSETQMDEILQMATDEELVKLSDDFFTSKISTESETIIKKYQNELTKQKNNFEVITYSTISQESLNKFYSSWSDGIKMIIRKGDVYIELNQEEVETLVKSLPRTFGGKY
jgi:hypothetical protein